MSLWLSDFWQPRVCFGCGTAFFRVDRNGGELKMRISHRLTCSIMKNLRRNSDNLLFMVFVTVISVTFLVAGCVIYRFAVESAYRQKWRDYDDCGWA